MPVGLELQSLYLENEIANEANNGFIINLIESILIVIVIIMLVMGLRAGVLIGSSLIFSIGGTLLIMSWCRTESYVAGGIHYRNGYAGRQCHCGDG